MPSGSSSSVQVFYPQLSSEQVVARLRESVPGLLRLLPLVGVDLFGSYAAGSYTVASDVDLLVVHKGEPRPDAYRLVRQAMRLPRLDPHVYTEHDAEAAKDRLGAMLQRSVPIYP
jgi:predicted nucleotidyltransferase